MGFTETQMHSPYPLKQSAVRLQQAVIYEGLAWKYMPTKCRKRIQSLHMFQKYLQAEKMTNLSMSPGTKQFYKAVVLFYQ